MCVACSVMSRAVCWLVVVFGCLVCVLLLLRCVLLRVSWCCLMWFEVVYWLRLLSKVGGRCCLKVAVM